MLVVDDAPSVVQVVSAALSAHCDLDIRPFISSAGALRYCRTREPDVAVLDVCMPDLDGVTLARALRVHYPQLPIVFMTGSPADVAAAESEVRFHPPVRVLTKPARVATLVAAVRAALGVHEPL
ncbi:MAG: response regulator [Nannocystaceae bacterium]|nr:response regulator [Nannocystaceae bacterium]